MPLLIDCYNVLHAPMPPALAGLDTAGLCRLLARTAWRDTQVHVVCDGQPGPLGLLESPVPGIDLHYAGYERTADQLIIDMIDADTAPRRLVVVSSDNEIRRAARRRRATDWPSDQFIRHLAAALARQPAPDARGKPVNPDLPPEEVDRWLRAFGYDTETRND